jgi:CRISPR-associated protein Cmr4
MIKRNLLIFTRTPLHVGAGSSVGAIDQPIQRERHTGFPIIPGSSLKGSFADHWNDSLTTDEKGNRTRGTTTDAAWLFGADDANNACAGALSFSEARLLAFPIRSAKGGYAWITCPMLLQRASRDGLLSAEIVASIHEPRDDQALFALNGPLDLPTEQLVLEEYCFSHIGTPPPDLHGQMASLIDDILWKSVQERLVILSNGCLSHFVRTTCEVAQHVRISDKSGTAADGALFNQENVPSDTLFYSSILISHGRGAHQDSTAEAALTAFQEKLQNAEVFQFGGDASTGLGFCGVFIR